jgi:hypothetical protein
VTDALYIVVDTSLEVLVDGLTDLNEDCFHG